MQNTEDLGNQTEMGQSGAIGLRDIWQTFLDKAWLVVCVMLAAAALGVWHGARSPVIYQSKAVLYFDSGEIQVLNIQDIERKEKAGLDLLHSIANNLKSSIILRRVVRHNELTNHVYFTQGTNRVGEDVLVRHLAGAVDVKLRRTTRLFDVTVELGDAKLTQIIGQGVLDEFLKQISEERVGAGTNAGHALLASESTIKARLLKAEHAVAEYRRTNNISLQDTSDILTVEFKALAEKLNEAKDEVRLLELEWGMSQKVGNSVEELLKLPMIARSPEVVALKEKLQAQEAKLSNLQLRYREKHPAMIQARNELSTIRAQFEEEIRRAPERLKLMREGALAKEKKLDGELKEQEKKLGNLSLLRIEYDRLQREAASERKLYDTVINRLREIDLTGGIEKKSEYKIIEPASLPTYPIRPNKRVILAYALVMGLAISVGLVWLLQQLDNSVKSVDHAERVFGLPVLGAIPKNKLVTDGKGRLFITDDPQSLCAEAFRTLRAALGLLGRDEDRKVVLFTSAVPSEGKSFTGANYAVSHAQQGKKTLIIDLDLRKPSLSETFGVSSNQIGATDVMLGREPFEKAVQTTRFENLFLMTAGKMVPNPAELLAGPWAKQLIAEASKRFDKVVLDNAPVNAVSDTLLICKEAHTICLVMHARRTPVRVVSRALEMLRRAGGKPSGVVLNFLPGSAGAGYYYYYSGNKYYGSKGVYGASSSKG
jgi:capsular exopolysaccharide synthesis family protein